MNLDQSSLSKRTNVSVSKLKDLGDTIKKLDYFCNLIESIKMDYQELIAEQREKKREKVD